MRRAFAGISTRALAVAILIIPLFALLVYGTHGGQRVRILMGNMYEDISDAVVPDAERAFLYGEKHFNSRAEDYDIARAERFFVNAMMRDPDLPLVRHELARVYFLKGDFPKALGFINAQVALHGDEFPNAYYVRGLIEGYAGDYAAAAKDYEHFLRFDPHNWAAMNDYAWVLLKAHRSQDAALVASEGLTLFPDNPWLLNSQAIALYEMNAFSAALRSAQKASAAVAVLSEAEWLRAYPGNDPGSAAEGIASFKKAVADNMHTIETALASSAVQSG